MANRIRFITWNCRIGGFRWKSKQIAPLKPDVLVVQEVEPIDQVLLFGGEEQPTFRSQIRNPKYQRRTLTVFSYTDIVLRADDTEDPMYSFRRMRGKKSGLDFQFVGLWTAHSSKKELSYRQSHNGISKYSNWIAQKPTVILGDFNSNASYHSDNWQELMDLMKPFGLVSAYHHFYGEDFGKETRHTYYHRAKEDSRFHVDYCFFPEAWVDNLVSVEVGDFDTWCEFSDHVPLVVDFDF